MWPMPRAPISRTRMPGARPSARSAVSGRPISLLREPGVPDRGRLALQQLRDAGPWCWSCRRSRSARRRWCRAARRRARARAPSAACDVVDDDRGHADGPGGEHGDGAGVDRAGGVVVAVDALAGEGGEEAAGRHLAGVR